MCKGCENAGRLAEGNTLGQQEEIPGEVEDKFGGGTAIHE